MLLARLESDGIELVPRITSIQIIALTFHSISKENSTKGESEDDWYRFYLFDIE